jgi:PadR family transcriptional regulator, regulatory protein AphA
MFDHASHVGKSGAVGNLNLTPTSYLVLGLLGAMGPSTSYDLKRAVSRSIGEFWSFPHSQLYAEPARLAEAGLLEERREEGGRRRRMWTVTPVGRRALDAWLAEPSGGVTEIRDLGLLKLFFGRQSTPEHVRALAEANAELHRRRMDRYRALDEQLAARRIDPYQRATLELGLRYERTATAFWEEMAAAPPGGDGEGT